MARVIACLLESLPARSEIAHLTESFNHYNRLPFRKQSSCDIPNLRELTFGCGHEIELVILTEALLKDRKRRKSLNTCFALPSDLSEQ